MSNALDQNKYTKQHSSNKYLMKIELNTKSEKIDDIEFSINALENSYYTIVADFVIDNQEIRKEITPGMINVITIDPKIIKKQI